MNTLSGSVLCALGLGVFAVAGCHKVSEPAPATAAEESPGLTPASRARSAAEQIAESRCEREQQCGNIGNDKTYATSGGCLKRIQSDWREDLSLRECPGGINEKELNECLGQVRAEACKNPFDALARMTECTVGQLCIAER
jgi:Family of unknown function (DUF6184)